MSGLQYFGYIFAFLFSLMGIIVFHTIVLVEYPHELYLLIAVPIATYGAFIANIAHFIITYRSYQGPQGRY